MLTPIQVHAASTAVRELRVAISNFFLYSSGNNMALLSLQRFLASLEELFQELPSVTLGESEGRLVLEGSALDDRTTGSTNMLKDLFITHKLHSLTFLKGLDTEELKTLFSLLRPKGLPTGLSLSQALVQKSLGHIKANEKVFVALNEGERVVSGEAGPGETGGGQNLQEALEALQYFLQIFERVKPTANKKEVAKKLMDHMGSWMGPGGEFPAAEGAQGAAASLPALQAWKDVMGGFMAMRDGLSQVKGPEDTKGLREGMEELMRKLVVLGEGQGLSQDAIAPPAGPSLESAPAPSAEETVLASVQLGRLDDFWDPAKEEAADRTIGLLQDKDHRRNFADLWAGIWERAASGEEAVQGLCLRHLNRLQWDKIPQDLQLQGLRNLRAFLAETKRASLYPVGLTLAQDWIPQELSKPDWNEVLEMAVLLRKLAEKAPQAFEKQNQAARVALETVFCEPILQSLFRRFQAGTPDGEGIVKLFAVLGSRETAFLFRKIETEQAGSGDWKRAAEILGTLQEAGHHVFEFYLGWPEKREYLEKFLDLFQVLPLPGELEDYFERHWNSFGAGAQEKVLGLAAKWKRKGFQPFLLRLLEHPQTPQAYQALQVLGELGLGEAAPVIESVRRFPGQGKEKERYWAKACEVLGGSGDASAEKALMEWADKYKFLEAKKDRSLEVRRAAIEGLGRLGTPGSKEFLRSLKKDIEGELSRALDKALG